MSTTKTLGYIGLGKMGKNMVLRLLEKGWHIVAYNKTPEETNRAMEKGADGAFSIEELIKKLPAPRLVWIMVPHQAVDDVLEELLPLLEKGGTIIEGGNSPYKETIRRGKEAEEKRINFLDIGVSGGPCGARNGACLMVGGPRDLYEKHEELFKDLSVENGYGHMGKTGAGHFVKMVHNGIEYGMMQAIGEGFEIMKKSDFDLDLIKITDVYSHGSVIESRLVSWLKNAYEQHSENLDEISGSISHSGEGLWTVEAAKKLGIPVPVIEGSLNFREESQDNPSYTGQVISALRNQFGGHEVKK